MNRMNDLTDVVCETCGYCDQRVIGQHEDNRCKFSPPVVGTEKWARVAKTDWCARWVPTPEEVERRVNQKMLEASEEEIGKTVASA